VVTTTVGLAAIVALILANAFFVAAEFSLVGARKTRLDQLSWAGNRKARLARRAIQSLDRYISATQLGITLASLGLGWIGEPTLAGLIAGVFDWLPSPAAQIATHSVAATLAFVIITVLHIILGELVPQGAGTPLPRDGELLGCRAADGVCLGDVRTHCAPQRGRKPSALVLPDQAAR
jgi:putative hemolysin